MPTGRAYAFLIAAVLLYLFGNQTQIGWLYVMAALLAGVILAAFILSRRSLAVIRGERQLSQVELYEGDPVAVQLRLERSRPAVQVAVTETCPLAAPDQQETSIFIPVLPGSITFDYQVEADRRGAYSFPPLRLESRAPFGFFRRRTVRDVPTHTLVYPEVRRLSSFSLFDRQIAAQMVYPRSGIGTEAIGVRPYRSGDSPRHIHWRSVARTGQLISKEFAEETRPGLTLVLDRYYPADFADKHNPFEWAVKCAVSIADYARGRGYPVYLLAETSDLPTPGGAVAWDALLQYMARVTPQTTPALNDLLAGRHLQTFVAVVIPWPEPGVIDTLTALKQRGYNVVPVVMNPATFPGLDYDAEAVMQNLDEAVPVTYGEDWTACLK